MENNKNELKRRQSVLLGLGFEWNKNDFVFRREINGEIFEMTPQTIRIHTTESFNEIIKETKELIDEISKSINQNAPTMETYLEWLSKFKMDEIPFGNMDLEIDLIDLFNQFKQNAKNQIIKSFNK